MYTILINEDNTQTHSKRERIMHRSSNVNTLQILIDPKYTDKDNEVYDMAEFTCILEYRLPISQTYVPVVLTPKEELYKEKIQYLYPLTTEFTSEIGEVEIKFMFTKIEMLPDGSCVEHVRPVSSSSITIIPVEQWSDYVSDSNLSSIAQIMLNLQAKIEQEKAYAEIIAQNKADNIKLDTEGKTIHLESNGNKIGDDIPLSDLADELINVNEGGMVKVII